MNAKIHRTGIFRKGESDEVNKWINLRLVTVLIYVIIHFFYYSCSDIFFFLLQLCMKQTATTHLRRDKHLNLKQRTRCAPIPHELRLKLLPTVSC